ncbi:uncharacterized protein LOC105353889 [Oryzias latipes]|uniref:uncharacterized protein LOC105353889 n=1 Tax=Oryzias latipes TaxID=8090 RepID=UPI0009D9B9C3|nr:uncharacterized protein LOC105353889 [Oryzias latipes]
MQEDRERKNTGDMTLDQGVACGFSAKLGSSTRRPGSLRVLHSVLAVPSTALFWTERSEVFHIYYCKPQTLINHSFCRQKHQGWALEWCFTRRWMRRDDQWCSYAKSCWTGRRGATGSSVFASPLPLMESSTTSGRSNQFPAVLISLSSPAVPPRASASSSVSTFVNIGLRRNPPVTPLTSVFQFGTDIWTCSRSALCSSY